MTLTSGLTGTTAGQNDKVRLQSYERLLREERLEEESKFREVDDVLEHQEEKKKKERDKNLKSYFFWLCFDQKNRLFPEDHLARFVQISALYNAAVNQGVLVDKWTEFIYNELSNAEKWVDVQQMKQIQRLQAKKKGLKRIGKSASRYAIPHELICIVRTRPGSLNPIAEEEEQNM